MKTKIQMLRLGLLALLLAIPAHSSFAAPPETGIRGQTFIFVPPFELEVSPGVFIGDGGFSFPSPASFTVFSAHSGREIVHVSSDADASFEVSLPPGDYVVVPDTAFGLTSLTGSFEVTVRPKHFTDAFIFYVSSPNTVTPAPP